MDSPCTQHFSPRMTNKKHREYNTTDCMVRWMDRWMVGWLTAMCRAAVCRFDFTSLLHTMFRTAKWYMCMEKYQLQHQLQQQQQAKTTTKPYSIYIAIFISDRFDMYTHSSVYARYVQYEYFVERQSTKLRSVDWEWAQNIKITICELFIHSAQRKTHDGTEKNIYMIG